MARYQLFPYLRLAIRSKRLKSPKTFNSLLGTFAYVNLIKKIISYKKNMIKVWGIHRECTGQLAARSPHAAPLTPGGSAKPAGKGPPLLHKIELSWIRPYDHRTEREKK